MANSLNARASAALWRWRWGIAIVGLLFVAYTAAGFLLVGGSVMPAQIFLTERASNKANNNSARMDLTLQ